MKPTEMSKFHETQIITAIQHHLNPQLAISSLAKRDINLFCVGCKSSVLVCQSWHSEAVSPNMANFSLTPPNLRKPQRKTKKNNAAQTVLYQGRRASNNEQKYLKLSGLARKEVSME